MLFRESVTTAVYVKCHLLARHVNERAPLCSPASSALCVGLSVAQAGGERLNDIGSHQCVCLHCQPRHEGGRQRGKKSINPRLHPDHLPLPSNGLTLWPPKVRRQLSRISRRRTTCQRRALTPSQVSFISRSFLQSYSGQVILRRPCPKERKETRVLPQNRLARR